MNTMDTTAAAAAVINAGHPVGDDIYKRHNPMFDVALRSQTPLAKFLREECELTGS